MLGTTFGCPNPTVIGVDPGAAHTGIVQGVSQKHCTVLQRGDGYGYLWKEDGAFLPALNDRVSSATTR